ncbi:hypothetical protein CgunFtcFv8_025688 [Champsocephalus gunnari]|uniref:Uncharacterized protein n=1 Tax=Champsocephalus gunnari TaxID=52237 RepID=A0AAN8H344_CHAGU|nr:hypothetical protein CgunFtcFv8_025688 [Champsocephalus gunnari]
MPPCEHRRMGGLRSRRAAGFVRSFPDRRCCLPPILPVRVSRTDWMDVSLPSWLSLNAAPTITLRPRRKAERGVEKVLAWY